MILAKRINRMKTKFNFLIATIAFSVQSTAAHVGKSKQIHAHKQGQNVLDHWNFNFIYEDIIVANDKNGRTKDVSSVVASFKHFKEEHTTLLKSMSSSISAGCYRKESARNNTKPIQIYLN